jgi:predicted metal-dependent hydrolase
MLCTTEEDITILCPPKTDFTQKSVQELLRNAIIRALKKTAQAYLPPLLNELAEHYDFTYKKVKITGSKSRWGSCSSTGSINLSCYLMLLPPHLMDYVLLHELTHTREMNHGPKFWEILNELTEGRAHSLRAELRNFRNSF